MLDSDPESVFENLVLGLKLVNRNGFCIGRADFHCCVKVAAALGVCLARRLREGGKKIDW